MYNALKKALIISLAALFCAGLQFSAAADDSAASPAWRDYFMASGYLHLKNGELAKAEDFFEKVYNENSKDIEAGIALAKVYIAKGDRSAMLRTLAEISRKNPKNAMARKAFGSAALSIGNIPFANRELQAACELAPDDAEALALYGSALWRIGEFEEAGVNFQKACEIDEKYCSPAVAVNATALYKGGKYSEALQSIEKNKHEAKGDYSQLVMKLRSNLYEKLSADKPFSAYIKLFGGYDTNAVYDPEMTDVVIAEEKAAPALKINGFLGWTPLIISGHTLGGDISASRNNYFDTSSSENLALNPTDKGSAADFNSTGLRGTARYRYSFSAFGKKQNLLAKYIFGLLLFDGGLLVEEDDLYVFSESHGGKLRYTLNHSESEETYIEAGGAHEGFRDIRRKGNRLDFSVGEGSFYLENRFKFFLTGLFTYADTFHESYDLINPGGFLGVSYYFSNRIEMVCTGRFSYKNYHHSKDYEPWGGVQRKDKIANASLSLSRLFLDFLRPELSVGYTKTFSTVESFDYKKFVVMAGVGAEY